jgi:hypothetical protein
MNNQSFSTNNTNNTNWAKGMLSSNSIFAKIVFLILVLFLFVILLRIGTYIIGYFFAPNVSPHLIDGMIDAQQMLIFKQNSSATTDIIHRSDNATEGIEFTWSIWVNIHKLDNVAVYQHIFHKGNSNLAENGLNFPNNAPGLYIKPDTNELVVIMNTFNVINEEIDIPNIPLNKWVNVIIRCRENILDVYINGTITRSITLNGVPKQNNGDVYVAQNGGFQGNISNLWYYNYALGTAAIQNIVAQGPNTYMAAAPPMNKTTDYLSLRWFFFGAGDMYNPT